MSLILKPNNRKTTATSHCMVSVLVLTYCHEKYIEQAMNSIVAQKTTFNFEILIGDDGSIDRTPEIISSYAHKYPSIVKPTFYKKNVGASYNLWSLLSQAQGQYIAFLEGDDFWISSTKLQAQYEFLESHPEYVGCSGKSLIVNEFSQPQYTQSCHFVWNKKIFTLNDFIKSWQLPGQLGSCMYRNIYLDMKPEEYAVIYTAHPMVCDKTNTFLTLLYGPIYCDNNVVSAYRFVDKSGEKNWFSMHHSDPYRNYDMFMYPCKLESWARKNLDLSLNEHLGKRNPYRFARFVEECIRDPQLLKFKCLVKMIVYSHQPLKYSWYVLKSLVEME